MWLRPLLWSLSIPLKIQNLEVWAAACFGMAVAFRCIAESRVLLNPGIAGLRSELGSLVGAAGDSIMKNRVLAGFAILALIVAGVFCIGAHAQTTDEGKGPSEQPSAPMEVGQQQGPQNPQAGPPPQPGAPPPPPGAPQAGPPQGGPGQAGPMGDAEPGGPSGEGPAANEQGVARISMIHGAVSTQRGDSGDWSAAILNQPVVGGDKVSTGDGGRAELQLDFANILRLGTNSKANIANLTKDKIQIQVGQGIANFTVFKESETEPEIDTPNVAVHPAHNDGVFRIEVRPDGDSLVIVRKGEAQISTPKGIAEVHQGEMATVRGGVDDAQYKISAAPDADSWDRWNSDRDHMIRDAQAWKHTNHYYTGSEDLDANGTWQSSPDYGEVWVPNEPEGWVPYRDGNWVWEPYYGWTWVGYEPWGWAPYHYGRWMVYGGGWAWWPGPVWGGGFYRPFWAPAYVSFYGWGWGFGFGFGWGGWGGFGWLPIGPGDWFHPWWGGYGGRFGLVGRGGYGRYGGFAPLRASGFSTVGHINDARVGGAMSAVNAGRFGAGRVTASAATREQLSGARMMAGNLPVVPSRASLSASGRAAAPSTIRGGTQSFYGTQSTARTESFARQTAQLRQSMQQNHVSSVQAGRGMSGSGFGEGRGAGTTARAGAGAGLGGRDSGGREMNSEATRSGGGETARSPEAGSETARGAGTTEGADRGGFRPFTPPSHSESGEAAGRSGGEGGSYWSRTAPSSAGPASRGYTDGYGRGGYSRPQLNMRQPVVQPRSSGGYHAPSYGGGSHSAPSGGGGHAAGGGGGHSGGGGHR